MVGELAGALKVSLTSPPVDGRANTACLEFLAEALNVPRGSISFISGQSSRNKVVRVQGLAIEELRRRLELAGLPRQQQHTIT